MMLDLQVILSESAAQLQAETLKSAALGWP